MQFETILLEKHKGVGLITLNRPKALNALNSKLIQEVNLALDDLDAFLGEALIGDSAILFIL